MGSDLLTIVRHTVAAARRAGLDDAGQYRRAVAEVLLLRPDLDIPEAVRVVEVARMI